MGLVDQTMALAAILVAALSSYMVGRLTDRNKFARELRIRWDQRRLDAYVRYLSAVKVTGARANRIHERRLRGGSLEHLQSQIDELEESEISRTEAFEALVLLADASTIEAGHELNEALWTLAFPARNETELSEDAWKSRNDRWVVALNDFHAAARADLKVHGALARRDIAALIVSQPDRGRRSGDERPSSADALAP